MYLIKDHCFICIYTSVKTQAEDNNIPSHRSTVSMRVLNFICEKLLKLKYLIPVWVLEQNSAEVNRANIYRDSF